MTAGASPVAVALAPSATALATASCGIDFLVSQEECSSGDSKSERNQGVSQETATALTQRLALDLRVTASA